MGLGADGSVSAERRWEQGWDMAGGKALAGVSAGTPAGTPVGTKAWGLGFAVLSSVCFGGSGAVGKALISAGFSPLQAVWLRIAGAALVLVPLVIVTRGVARLRRLRPLAPQLILYGATGVAGCQACYFVAAARLPVGVAILLEFTGPVLVLGWVRIVRRTPVQRTAAVGVAVAMVGLACVVQVWSGLRLDAVGLLAGLGAAACQAAYFLLVERLTGDIDPLAMTAVGSVVGAVLLAVLAMPWSIPWHILPTTVTVAGHSAPAWLLAAWMIVVSTVIAYIAGIAAVQRLSAQVAGAIGYIEAVAATLIAWAVLGERLATVQIVGGVIVLAGAFIAQRAAPGRASSVSSASSGAEPGGVDVAAGGSSASASAAAG
jgi:drug/metabolite transporter (DMT)-like permease